MKDFPARDRRRWPYALQVWAGDNLLIEVVLGDESSFAMELAVSKSRIDNPLDWTTHMAVDGAPMDLQYATPRTGKPAYPPSSEERWRLRADIQ